MSTTVVIILVAVIAVLIAVLGRSSGPRITTIEHRRDEEDREDRR